MAEDTRDSSQIEKNDDSDVKPNIEIEIPAKSDSDEHQSDKEATDKVDSTDNIDTIDNSNLHYEGDVCVYTDPASKFEYVWNSEKNEWVLRTEDANRGGKNSSYNIDEKDSAASEDVQSAETSANEQFSKNDYEFDGETYCYKDSKSGITYKYDSTQKTWVEKDTKNIVAEEDKDSDDSDEEAKDNVIKQDMTTGTYGFEGDTHTYTDTTDGTVYLWDREKNAWFPKVDDDFLAHYQMNYGFTESSTASSTEKEPKVEEKKEAPEENSALKRKAPQEPSWFEMDDQHNTKVYVSNLPLDITEQEFVDVMQKCGLVMKDLETGKMKIKLYTEPGTNQLKGDGLCSYIKIESVDLAIKLLDGYDFKGHKLHVERARFQMKGNYDPNLKPKKRKKKEKEKLKKMQEKLFDWRPDKLRGERSKHEKIVIVKNLFDPNIFDKDVKLILEYQQDLREECSKCGDVRKVTIYDRHPEGVAQINFREPEEADACVTLLNGRWFGQRKITAETWDGKTKYKIAETEAEIQQRLQKWDKFLETGEAGKKVEADKQVDNSVKDKEAGTQIETVKVSSVMENKTADNENISQTVESNTAALEDSGNRAENGVDKEKEHGTV